MVDFIAASLLRTHIRDGANTCARSRDGRSGVLRQSEVDDLHDAVLSQDHVGRLDIAVNDLPSGCLLHTTTNLRSDIQRLGKVHDTLLDTLLKRVPFVVLHRNENTPVVGLTDLMNRTYVRVVERCRCFGFDQESLPGIRVCYQVVGQKFDRNNAVETRISGLVDDAHATNTEPLQNLVMEKLLPLKFAGRAKRAAGSDAVVIACPIVGVVSYFRFRHDVEGP